jgi:hypothetical protein
VLKFRRAGRPPPWPAVGGRQLLVPAFRAAGLVGGRWWASGDDGDDRGAWMLCFRGERIRDGDAMQIERGCD